MEAFTEAQQRAFRRLQLAVKACQSAGLVLVADLDVQGIKVFDEAAYAAVADNVRDVEAETVPLNDACGGGSARVSGEACSMTYV